MLKPRASNDDLTATARIRNTVLDLYARYDEDRISRWAVAAKAARGRNDVDHPRR